jgi:cytochrome P450
LLCNLAHDVLMVSFALMTTEATGKQAVLDAFDRLFERALLKLKSECSPEEKAEVKRNFVERYGEALQLLDKAEFPAFTERSLAEMEDAIEAVSAAHVAGYLAVGPLAVRVQEFMQRIAMRAAEQRLLEQLAAQADETYGGN